MIVTDSTPSERSTSSRSGTMQSQTNLAATIYKPLPTAKDSDPLLPRAPPPYIIVGSPIQPHRRNAIRRFIEACIIATLILLVVSALRTFHVLSRPSSDVIPGWPNPPSGTGSKNIPLEPASAGHPISSDGDIEVEHLPFEPYSGGLLASFEWPSNPTGPPPYAVITKFELPSKATSVYFLSRAGSSVGSIRFVPATDGATTVRGEVVTRYWDDAQLDHVNLATLRKGEDGAGLGIYMDYHYQWEFLHFEVTVFLPNGKACDGVVKSLETMMPIFTHHLADFSATPFEMVDLFSTQSSISAESLIADDIVFKTENAQISGTFQVNNTIALRTSNSRISGKIEMKNDDWKNPAKVELRSSNGAIDIDLSLITSSEFTKEYTGSGMKVEASTSNSALSVRIPSAPLDSSIEMNTHTSNSRSYVLLPDTYEGSIAAHTSNAPLRILNHPETKDPAGQDRQRKLQPTSVFKNSWSGRVSWEPTKDRGQRAPYGAVTATTSNSQNTVELR